MKMETNDSLSAHNSVCSGTIEIQPNNGNPLKTSPRDHVANHIYRMFT